MRDASGQMYMRNRYYDPATSQFTPPSVPDNTWTPDETTRQYDASGNVSRGYQQVGGIGTSGDAVIAREVESRSFYGADDRLRMFQTYDVRRAEWSNYVNAGVWEEYRYDALGRRVMVRTRTDDGLCEADPWTCTSSVTRLVWAGDNLLWELKQADGSMAAAADGSMAAAAGGSVSYSYAGGVDRPLVITTDGQRIIPLRNTVAAGRAGEPRELWYAAEQSSPVAGSGSFELIEPPWHRSHAPTALAHLGKAAASVHDWLRVQQAVRAFNDLRPEQRRGPRDSALAKLLDDRRNGRSPE